MAIQQSSITGSMEPVAAALRQADDRLARYSQPRLERVRRAVSRATQRHRNTLCQYPLGPGDESLRRAVARHTLRMGCGYEAKDIVITNSCLESISLCLRAVTKPGDVVALESPTYFGLLEIVENLHLRALEIPTPRWSTLLAIKRQLPFAAGRVMGDLSDAGSRTEVEARILLWSVERLVGALATTGRDHDLASRLHVLLPGSPNRGMFGVTTYTTDEMAGMLLELCTPEARVAGSAAPLQVDLTDHAMRGAWASRLGVPLA